ncbi:hypothetical protein ACUIAL_08875 [Dermabacteraceae bacterium P13136]
MKKRKNNFRREENRKEIRDKWAEYLRNDYAELGDLEEDSLIAFIDETDYSPVDYYGIAAVITKLDDLPSLRKRLSGIALRSPAAKRPQGVYWHTSEEYHKRGVNGPKDVLDMTRVVLGKTLPVFMFTVSTSGGSVKKYREQVMEEMLYTLHDYFGSRLRIYVVECRQALAHDFEDSKTWRAVNKRIQSLGRGKLGKMRHVEPYKECCLWMPDVVAWASQRAVFGSIESDLLALRILAKGDFKNLALRRGGLVEVPIPRTSDPRCKDELYAISRLRRLVHSAGSSGKSKK